MTAAAQAPGSASMPLRAQQPPPPRASQVLPVTLTCRWLPGPGRAPRAQPRPGRFPRRRSGPRGRSGVASAVQTWPTGDVVAEASATREWEGVAGRESGGAGSASGPPGKGRRCVSKSKRTSKTCGRGRSQDCGPFGEGGAFAGRRVGHFPRQRRAGLPGAQPGHRGQGPPSGP